MINSVQYILGNILKLSANDSIVLFLSYIDDIYVMINNI